jgi:hypothetical protein
MRSFAAPLALTVYYENAGHNSIFTDPQQFDDCVRRIAAFIAQPTETR